jgi:ribonuclease T1
VIARSSGAVLLAVAVALALGLALAAAIADGPRSSDAPVRPSPTGVVSSPAAPDGLAVVALGGLPAEARETIARITAGGPFPFRADGATFENREGLLPDRPRGYYREYTVPTPGSDDRGARRIVTGRDGEMYWTADHYDSFAWIAR